MRGLIGALMLVSTTPAFGNDWQKFYTPIQTPYQFVKSQAEPELVPASGSADEATLEMFRNGFAPLGYTSFNSPNGNTKDAVRWGAKLGARYILLSTQLVSSNTVAMPLTLPTTTTSTQNGTVSATGTGGFATGTYSGQTTTYGTQTTYVPVTVQRFDKGALYFAEMARKGSGMLSRALTPDEVSRYETQRAFVVRAVRTGSPAYNANILPGDLVLKVDGLPADLDAWNAALRSTAPVKLSIIRNDTQREIELTIPAEWRLP